MHAFFRKSQYNEILSAETGVVGRTGRLGEQNIKLEVDAGFALT